MVTKEELLDEVWGDRFVSESALTSRLKAARRQWATTVACSAASARCTAGATGSWRSPGRSPAIGATRWGRLASWMVTTPGGPPPSVLEAAAPIRYTRRDELNIAYQVTGAGGVDLVLVGGFVSHLMLDWTERRHAHFLHRLGTFSRLIRFDKRGTGMSDRPGAVPDLETRMGDVVAVMDAARLTGGAVRLLRGRSDVDPVRRRPIRSGSTDW